MSTEAIALYKKLSGLDEVWDFDLKRDDPLLIEVIETLGVEKASDRHAELVIYDLPADVNWYITDYDGKETIREHHRTW